jgi:hypothetical protein
MRGLTPRSSEFYDVNKLSDITDELMKKIKIFDLLKDELIYEHRIPEARARKFVNRIYKEKSDEYWDEYYQKYIEYVDRLTEEKLTKGEKVFRV